MSKLRLPWLVVALLASSSCCEARAEQSLGAAAQQALKLQNWDQARQIYRHIYQSDKNNPQANAFLGREAHCRGNIDDARRMLECAVQGNALDSASAMLLAGIYARSNDHQRAQEIYRQVLKIDPANLTARLNLMAEIAGSGRPGAALGLGITAPLAVRHDYHLQVLSGLLYLQTDRPQEALRCFKAARENDSKNNEIFRLLAIACGARNDWTSATAYARTYSKVEPESADAQAFYGWCAYANGDLVEANTQLSRALELNPGDTGIRNLLALVLTDRRQFAAAKEQLDRALQVEPEAIDTQLNLAMLELLTDKAPAGLERAKLLVAHHPECVPAISLLAYARLLNGQDEEAEQSADAALKKQSNDPLAQSVMVKLALNRGDTTLAQTRAETLLATAGSACFNQSLLSEVFLKLGEWTRAVEHAQLALQAAPSNLQAKTLLGKALAGQKNWPGAVLYLREVAARTPGDYKLKLELVRALIQQGDYEAAARMCESAHKLAPQNREPLQLWLQVASSLGDRKLERKTQEKLDSLTNSKR